LHTFEQTARRNVQDLTYHNRFIQRTAYKLNKAINKDEVSLQMPHQCAFYNIWFLVIKPIIL